MIYQTKPTKIAVNCYRGTICLGGAVVECWTCDWKVTGSTASRGAIKSTRSTQPSIPLE